MKKILLTVAIAVVIIFLGFPYFSWGLQVEDDYDMELTLGVSAICNGYLEDAYFTHTQAYDELMSSTYWDYLDGYWSFSEVDELPAYPYLSVVIQGEYDYDSREVWRVPYTYGETLEWSGEYPTYHGEVLVIQLHIYHEKGYSSSLSWKEIVP